MFREIESCMTESVSSSGKIGTRDSNDFGIESYGISVTTLEEVFLRVAGCDCDEVECVKQGETIISPDSVLSEASYGQSPRRISFSKLLGNCTKFVEVISIIVGRACGLIIGAVFNFINFLSMQCCSCCLMSRSMLWQHCKALFIKRAISARRDQKTIAFQLLIPAVFLFFGLLFLKLKPHPDQLSVTFTTLHFNPLLSGGGGGGPIPFDLSWPIAKEVR